MDKLNITIIQPDIVWEKTSVNLNKYEKLFEKIEKSDMVVLPEMFHTGFTMNVEEFAQPMNGRVVSWMQNHALEQNFAIMGSTTIKDEEDIFNRFIMAMPCGTAIGADKRHLFRMGEEHKHFSPGTKQKIFQYFGWRIRPLVCYDLRFPVWSRNQNDYDLLIYVANWPAPRREVWKTLLKARAIENQCYVIGVNRVGKDGMDIDYTGDSMVIDFKGNVIAEVAENTEGMASVSLSLSELQQFRDKFPAHLDADKFEVKI
ncbi:MAG: amidohydrolase [Salinivirgaceae bacterium]|nr:amidohydrolase [Salinivirgaceae bacterium]